MPNDLVNDHATDSCRAHAFADADQARAVVCGVRKLLARYLDGADVPNSVLLVVAAKVLDEVRRDRDRRFVAVPDEPRVSSSRFDSLERETARALADTAGLEIGAEADVPELVAHEVLRQLGAFSVVVTAEGPAGPEIVRALFAEAMAGGADTEDASRAVRAFAEVLRRATAAAPGRAAGFGLVSSAAIGALGDRGASSSADAPGLAPSVVDLRDAAKAAVPSAGS